MDAPFERPIKITDDFMAKHGFAPCTAGQRAKPTWVYDFINNIKYTK